MKAGRLTYALAQLSERERTLLFLLTAVALPIAIVFLAALPLMEARDKARGAAEEAEALLGWVSDQVRALPADSASVSEAGSTSDAIGITGIEESLVRYGLRNQVSQLSNRSEGGIDVALEAAPFDALSDWLTGTAPDWGYEIGAFRIEAADPGLVNATFELEVAP